MSSPSPTAELPSYGSSSNNITPDAILFNLENLTLVLKRDKIVSKNYPDRKLYQLSWPIDGKSATIGIEKFLYKVKDSEPPQYEEVEGGNSLLSRPEQNDSKNASSKLPSMLDIPNSPSEGPRLTSRRAHIYSVSHAWFKTIGDTVVIQGQRKESFTTGIFEMRSFKSSWKLRTSEEQYNPMMYTFGGEYWKVTHKGKDWVWTNEKGKEIAVEVGANVEGNAVEKVPSLELRVLLPEKEMDVIVAAWIARLAFDSWKKEKEPMNWDKFKRIASSKNGVRGGIYG